MPSPDFYNPYEPVNRPFESSIEFNVPQSAPEVAAETKKKIQIYFNHPNFWRLHAPYIHNQSLDLVESARRGFLSNPQAVRNIGLIDPPVLDALDLMNKQYSEEEPSPEDAESFARMYIAFGMVPDIAVSSGLPAGYSRSLLLQPPFTVDEVLGRIHEVGITLGRMRDEKIPRNQNLVNMPYVLRSYWTLDAMGRMPLRNPLSDLASFIDEAREGLSGAA